MCVAVRYLSCRLQYVLFVMGENLITIGTKLMGGPHTARYGKRNGLGTLETSGTTMMYVDGDGWNRWDRCGR